MSQQNKRKQELKTVRGYVVELPSSKRDGSDEEEEDDDDDDNWLDYSQIKNAFSEGTFVKQNKKPRYTRVTLRDLDSGKQTHSCFGRFVLLDPWWEMRVTIGPEKRVQGLTSYCVRQDEDGIVKQNLIPFLLSTALRRYNKHAGQLVDQLDTFIKTRGLKKVIFEDIDPLLQQFMQTHPADRHCIMEARRQDTIQGVLRGTRYPDLLQFLCRLFPLTFLSCLLSPMMDTLAGLEKAAETQPWVFGFRAILASKFNVYGIEANFRAFELCGLMEATIPTVQKDALYIYEILKTDAGRNGHTYVSFADLREHRHWKDLTYEVDDWGPALTFLAENGVTKEERFDSGRNFFLYHNWKAEVDIADGLKEVMSRGVEAKKPAWDVDFTSEDLSGLRGDGDQWLAAQKVAASPVCIMSGKGGCGKTTVVTKVTQHICRQPPAAEEKMDDVDDLLANAELREAFGAQADRRKPDSASSQPVPAQVTPEELSQMIQTTTQALEESQAQGSRFRISQEKRKRDGIQVDLTTDLIKYLGTTGDTALSRTPNGRKILLTAPTGKAAKLLGHKAKMESCTLHRVIYSYRAFVKEQKKKEMDEKKRTGWNDAQNQECPAEKNGSPAKGKDIRNNSAPTDHQNEDVTVEEGVWKYARTEVLVVDECSLVSLRLFATLINILIENTPLWKVVLLGDVRQLPSIEPGNFLADLFKTFKERGLSVELRTNHRSESELIVSNATRISQRHLPVIDPGRHFHFLAIEDSEHSADPERDAAVRDMLVNRLETHSHETSQFVTFRRVDCDAINELCCQHYNQHTTREAKASGSKQPYDFRIGDKICFRKNGQVLNQGLKLRAYLQDYPEILGAFGISPMKGGKDTKKENRTMDVTTTAATEQILNGRDEGKEGNLQSAANQHSKEHKDKLHRTLRGATVEQGTSCESLSQPSRASVKQEKLGGEECETGDEWSGEMISSTHSGVKVKQEKKEQGEGTPGSLSASNRPHGVLVKEEKPRGDGDSECFSRYSSADYHIQATDFGVTMGRHVSQTGDGAGVAMPRTSGCQLRLGGIGAEDCGVSFAGSAPEGSQPSPSQDKDDEEEERAGKLKNGLVRLCNGEVFFIMDDVRETDEKGKELRFLTLSDRDPECPRVVCVSYVALKRECRLRHAWARTIHTYQGSESDTVIYYVGDSRIQNWKHVYTAVTRGRKAVFMVGKDSELRQSVWRGDYPRRSRLSRRLHDMMKGLPFQDLHAMMRTVNDQAKDALLLPTTTPPATTPSTQPPPPSLASDPMGGGQPSITTPTSSDVASKQCVIDPFPDSDDSWVRDMSPVWAADYVASKQNSHGAGRADNPESPDLYLEDDWDSPPRAAGNMEVENSQGPSPGKQQRLVLQEEQMLSTPKRPVGVKSSDPLDSIISPVRRNLSL